jgi:hypothetical protein
MSIFKRDPVCDSDDGLSPVAQKPFVFAGPSTLPLIATQDGVFRGLIIEEPEDEVERDGGGFSKPRVKPPRSDASSKYDIVRKQKDIRIQSLPKCDGSQPGLLVCNGQNLKTFYYGERMIEATDNGVQLAERYDDNPPLTAEFMEIPKPKQNNSDIYHLVNKEERSICLMIGNGQPQLVSLTQSDITSRGNTVHQWITVFYTEKVPPCNSKGQIALYFTIQEGNNQFNYYLSPIQEENDGTAPSGSKSIYLHKETVTGLSNEQITEINRNYLYFQYEYPTNARPDSGLGDMSRSQSETPSHSTYTGSGSFNNS